jgi:hypothetical protein
MFFQMFRCDIPCTIFCTRTLPGRMSRLRANSVTEMFVFFSACTARSIFKSIRIHACARYEQIVNHVQRGNVVLRSCTSASKYNASIPPKKIHKSTPGETHAQIQIPSITVSPPHFPQWIQRAKYCVHVRTHASSQTAPSRKKRKNTKASHHTQMC